MNPKKSTPPSHPPVALKAPARTAQAKAAASRALRPGKPEATPKAAPSLQKLAFTDELTGLANERQIEATADEFLRQSGARHPRVYVLVMVISGLDRVVDFLGNLARDHVLKEVGHRLVAASRNDSHLTTRASSYHLGHNGRGEFLLCIHEGKADLLGHLEGVAGELIQAVTQPMRIDNTVLDVSGRIGWAVSPQDGSSGASLITHARMSTSMARREGVSVRRYEAAMDPSSPDGRSFIETFRRAVRSNELSLYAQPKIRLLNGEMAGAECLLRWQHPERGILSPDHFLPYAAESGLMHEITLWVVDEATRRWMELREKGMLTALAVNISAHDLVTPDLAKRLESRVRKHNVMPQSLCLEVTERALSLAPRRSHIVIRELHEAGFRLSVDDFGAYQSSFKDLSTLCVNEIKLDSTLVAGMRHSDRAQCMVRSLIQAGHDQGFEVVAEAVENEGVALTLMNMGCDLGQGWHMARPMPLRRLHEWSADRLNLPWLSFGRSLEAMVKESSEKRSTMSVR